MTAKHKLIIALRDFLTWKNTERVLSATSSEMDMIEEEVIENTPVRFLMSLLEFMEGYNVNLDKIKTTTFPTTFRGIVWVKNIRYFSLCEHHLLPFHGNVHVAYIPNETNPRIIGASKIPRIVEVLSRRLQVQERLTEQIVHAIEKAFPIGSKPCGVACICSGIHTCICGRGVRSPDAGMITSTLSGVFMEDSMSRQELFSGLGGLT